MTTTTKAELNWRNERAEWQQDGFDIVAKIRPDEDPDLSWLGTYTDSLPAGEAGRDYIDREKEGDWTSREYRYFVPGNSYAEAVSSLVKMGYTPIGAKRMAKRYVHQDYQRCEDYNRGGWSMTYVSVTASREGVELGRASLGGIESDAGDYITDTALELVGEAVKEAETTLEELWLCKC